MTDSGAQNNPTAVMGRRVAAHLIDATLYVAAIVVPFLALATRTRFESLSDDQYRIDVADGQAAVRLGEEVFFMADTEFFTVLAIGLGAFLLFEILLQGLAGFTVGKLLLGLRVVDGDGFSPGVGRATVRTLMWIFDGLPLGYIVPLLGFVTATASRSHRRLGDMAASTLVVDRKAKGHALRTEVTAATANDAPAWEGDGTEGDTDWRDDEWGDDEPADSTAESAAAQGREADTDGGGGGRDVVAPAKYDPEWDAERGAYIQWDPRREAWLQFDEDANQWRPIST